MPIKPQPRPLFDDHLFSTTVGVDLGGTKLLIRYRDQWVRRETGVGFGIAELTRALREFLDDQSEPPASLGIAVPGLVESGMTVAACDVLPRLVGWNAEQALDGRVARCSLVNDAKAALHATTFDLPPGSTAITVMVGTAVGCGIMVDGSPLRGASGWAGELGYWPVRAGAQWARLDEVAGGGYIAARLGIDGQQLACRVAQGDPAALALVEQGGQALGGALAGALNLLNPHQLSVGGGTLRLDGYWSAALAVFQAQSLPAMLSACKVRRVDDIKDLVAIGAARMAQEGTR